MLAAVAGWHGDDLRPPVWVGHVFLGVSDPKRSRDFFLALGMRAVEPDSSVPIFELRGGTHLILLPSETPPESGTRAPFDLMVDDLARAHAGLRARGLEPSPIAEGDFHRFFTLREPGGYEVVVNSSHASGEPV
jgi:catechol 2,3-dioxygenase-like lactoylglutathione lyase family enzyme